MKFDSKYKDRKPSDTIELIKKFFEERGFELQLSTSESCYGTFSAVSRLFYKNLQFSSSNGKGLSKELATASCLGELFERYCNFPHYTISNIAKAKIFEC